MKKVKSLLDVIEDINREDKIFYSNLEKKIKILKKYELIFFILNIVFILISYISFLHYLDASYIIENNKIIFLNKDDPNFNSILTIYNFISLLLLIVVIPKAIILVLIKKYNLIISNIWNNKKEKLLKFKNFKYLLIELIICILTPIPFLHSKIALKQSSTMLYLYTNSVINILISFKIFFILRSYLILSKYNDIKYIIYFHRKKINNMSLNMIIKMELDQNPYKISIMLYIISVFIYGFLLKFVETLFEDNIVNGFNNYQSIVDSCWNIIIAMTTVGYGDISPKTHIGRIIIVLSVITGSFLQSMLLLAMTISSKFSQQQQKAYDNITYVYKYTELIKKSGNFIKSFIIKYNLHNDKLTNKKFNNINSKNYYYIKFTDDMIKFRDLKKLQDSKQCEIDLETELINFNRNLDKKFNYLDTVYNTYNSIKNKVVEIEQNYYNILNLLTEVNNINELSFNLVNSKNAKMIKFNEIDIIKEKKYYKKMIKFNLSNYYIKHIKDNDIIVDNKKISINYFSEMNKLNRKIDRSETKSISNIFTELKFYYDKEFRNNSSKSTSKLNLDDDLEKYILESNDINSTLRSKSINNSDEKTNNKITTEKRLSKFSQPENIVKSENLSFDTIENNDLMINIRMKSNSNNDAINNKKNKEKIVKKNPIKIIKNK